MNTTPKDMNPFRSSPRGKNPKRGTHNSGQGSNLINCRERSKISTISPRGLKLRRLSLNLDDIYKMYYFSLITVNLADQETDVVRDLVSMLLVVGNGLKA